LQVPPRRGSDVATNTEVQPRDHLPSSPIFHSPREAEAFRPLGDVRPPGGGGITPEFLGRLGRLERDQESTYQPGRVLGKEYRFNSEVEPGPHLIFGPEPPFNPYQPVTREPEVVSTPAWETELRKVRDEAAELQRAYDDLVEQSRANPSDSVGYVHRDTTRAIPSDPVRANPSGDVPDHLTSLIHDPRIAKAQIDGRSHISVTSEV
jgi:hypothetical protein